MQFDNLPDSQKISRIEHALQPERLARYMSAARQEKTLAFQLYMWNCNLSQSFYTTLHFAEIVFRNALNTRLIGRFGKNWFEAPILIKILDGRYRDEFAAAVTAEKAQHGAACTAHHIASALTFGFWQHLLTKRFERLLWPAGVAAAFPFAPNRTTREDIYRLVESIRRWRNRIAHHRAIFDKGPMQKHQEALLLIGWVCKDTGSWVASLSAVPAIIAARPKV